MASGFRRIDTYPFVLKRLSTSPSDSPRLSRTPSPGLARGQRDALEGVARVVSNATFQRTFLLAASLCYLYCCVFLPQQLSQATPGTVASPPYAIVSNGGRSATDGQRSIAALLQSNRRMAMELPSRTSLGTGTFEYDASTLVVDYRQEGNGVPLLRALDASAWNEPPIYSTVPVSDQAIAALLQATQRVAATATEAPLPEYCPQGPIRVFIGITSRSSTRSAIIKRAAIRNTWLKTLKAEFNNSMAASFMLSQPDGNAQAVEATATMLSEEIARNSDIAVLPGRERYLELPAKTFALLQYALSSPCRYTHVVKTDDDVFLRPLKLLQLIQNGERDYSMDFYYNGTMNASAAPGASPSLANWPGVGDDRTKPSSTVIHASNHTVADHLWNQVIQFDARPPKPGELGKPWMQSMYVGKLDSNKTGVFPGWEANRTTTCKWYLPEDTLPDAESEGAMGVRWVSGWGYMLSRDNALRVVDDAVRYATSEITERPPWWGKLPWEDIIVAVLLARHNNTQVTHHKGFKAAWDGCGPDTILKHLDNDAPMLTQGLQSQEENGLWSVKEVTCSTGPHEAGNYNEWRKWRNSLPDNIKGGFM